MHRQTTEMKSKPVEERGPLEVSGVELHIEQLMSMLNAVPKLVDPTDAQTTAYHGAL